jgi:hypothetical protein
LGFEFWVKCVKKRVQASGFRIEDTGMGETFLGDADA